MLTIGEEVQNFELDAFHDEQIKKISLKDYRGKWVVLLFYPGDFTFICPTELEEAAELYEEFKKCNAEVLSISTDSVHVHKAWHDTSPAIKKVQYPMLADQTGKVCRQFGTYISNNDSYAKDEGRSYRGSFIIDPDGKLRVIEIHDNSVGRNGEEILRKLQAAVFVSQHQGEVCPAKWRPGKQTLKPGLDLVGKI
ncbi:MAG: redoxin domain-containing protein [bacterium]